MVGKEEHSLEAELAVAEIEEVLQGWAEQVDDHGIVVTLCPEPTDKGNADATGKRLVDLGLVLELRVLSLDGLELDGDLLARDDVDPEIDVTYRVLDGGV